MVVESHDRFFTSIFLYKKIFFYIIKQPIQSAFPMLHWVLLRKKGTMNIGRFYNTSKVCYLASQCHWTLFYAYKKGRNHGQFDSQHRVMVYRYWYKLKSQKRKNTSVKCSYIIMICVQSYLTFYCNRIIHLYIRWRIFENVIERRIIIVLFYGQCIIERMLAMPRHTGQGYEWGWTTDQWDALSRWPIWRQFFFFYWK